MSEQDGQYGMVAETGYLTSKSINFPQPPQEQAEKPEDKVNGDIQ